MKRLVFFIGVCIAETSIYLNSAINTGLSCSNYTDCYNCTLSISNCRWVNQSCVVDEEATKSSLVKRLEIRDFKRKAPDCKDTNNLCIIQSN